MACWPATAEQHPPVPAQCHLADCLFPPGMALRMPSVDIT